jgi:hypothetical protein
VAAGLYGPSSDRGASAICHWDVIGWVCFPAAAARASHCPSHQCICGCRGGSTKYVTASQCNFCACLGNIYVRGGCCAINSITVLYQYVVPDIVCLQGQYGRLPSQLCQQQHCATAGLLVVQYPLCVTQICASAGHLLQYPVCFSGGRIAAQLHCTCIYAQPCCYIYINSVPEPY